MVSYLGLVYPSSFVLQHDYNHKPFESQCAMLVYIYIYIYIIMLRQEHDISDIFLVQVEGGHGIRHRVVGQHLGLLAGHATHFLRV